MLVWSADFPLRKGTTTERFIGIGKEWILGSPHSVWEEKDFHAVRDGELVDFQKDKQSVSIAKVKLEGVIWSGLCHRWVEDDKREWRAELVGRQEHDDFYFSLQLHCDGLLPGNKLPKPKKPYIIKQLMEHRLGGYDGDLEILDRPVFLDELDVDFATEIINGDIEVHLPVIYASATWENCSVVNVIELAKWTSGLAHVLVEPSRAFSFELARATHGRNAYAGAISIYWPRGEGSQYKFFLTDYASRRNLAGAIYQSIVAAKIRTRPISECTWSFIIEQLSKWKIAELRREGSTKVEEYIELFDSEIRAKESRLRDAESEINRLRAELQRTTALADAQEGGILQSGSEKPFYAGELSDAVLTAIQRGKGQMAADSRYRHIVDDIVQSNEFSDVGKRIEEDIDVALKKSSSFGKNERRLLERLGFAISDEGKHMSATYHNDPRYLFTIQRTGSDFRGMKNLASEVKRKLLK